MKSYFDQEVVGDAHIALGQSAAKTARRLKQTDENARGLIWGELNGANPDQSVLLMQIGELTIAEWSHNGKFRAWSSESIHKPKFYRSAYSASELKRGSNKIRNVNGNYSDGIVHLGNWVERAKRYVVHEPAFDCPEEYEKIETEIKDDCVGELRPFLKLFSVKQVNNVSDWDGLSQFDQIDALGELFAEIENPSNCEKMENGEGYRLSFDCVADGSAASLQYADFSHIIKLKSHSNIGSQNYRIEWQAFGNGRQLNVSRTGCFLKLGTENYRIGSPIWSIIECIDKFKFSPSNTFDENTAFVATLKSLLPQVDESAVQFDGELATISLQHAAAFSLQITGSKNSLSFNPVLFNKVAKDKAANSDVLIEEDEQALLPDDARNFVASFKKTKAVNSSYLIGPGKYVFVDPSLKPALEIVKDAQSFDLETRIEFAKAPQKFIKHALESKLGDLSDIDLEIEAESIDISLNKAVFGSSYRNSVWETPDLPRLNSEPQDWKSDGYVHHVQGKTIRSRF